MIEAFLNKIATAEIGFVSGFLVGAAAVLAVLNIMRNSFTEYGLLQKEWDRTRKSMEGNLLQNEALILSLQKQIKLLEEKPLDCDKANES